MVPFFGFFWLRGCLGVLGGTFKTWRCHVVDMNFGKILGDHSAVAICASAQELNGRQNPNLVSDTMLSWLYSLKSCS